MFVSDVGYIPECCDLPVGASPLLPEHQRDSHGESVQGLRIRESHLDLLDERQLFVSAEVGNNVLELLGDFEVVDRLGAHGGKSLAGFFDAALLDEPAGALVGEEESGEEDSTGEDLESEGHAPLAVVGAAHVLDGAVVDEEGQTDTGDALRVVSMNVDCELEVVDLLEKLHAADASLWKVLA